MSTEEESLNIEKRDDAVIVTFLDAEVTMFVLAGIRMQFTELLKEKPPRLVLDFQNTSFLDSSGIAMIFKLQSETAAYGGRFCVAGLRPNLLKVFHAVVKKDEILFFDNVDAALSA